MRLNRINPALGYGMVGLSSILFSAKAVFIKLGYRHGVEPVVFMALRMAFSLPFFLAMAWIFMGRKAGPPARMGRQDWAGVAFLGLMGYYLASFFDLQGLQYVSAGLERLILYVYPTLVVLLSAWIFRRPLEKGMGMPLALTYAGIALSFGGEAISASSARPYLGGFLILLSALCYALFLIVQGKMVLRVEPARFPPLFWRSGCWERRREWPSWRDWFWWWRED